MADMGLVGLSMASAATKRANQFEEYAEELEKKHRKMAFARGLYESSHFALEELFIELNGGPLTLEQRKKYKEIFLQRANDLEIPSPENHIPERFR
jgi:hypothetical protein